jgi:hypothetical protein
VTPVARRQTGDDETPNSVEAQSTTRDEEAQALSLAAERILKRVHQARQAIAQQQK